MRTPKHHNQQWTAQDVKQLTHLASENTPTRVIASADTQIRLCAAFDD